MVQPLRIAVVVNSVFPLPLVCSVVPQPCWDFDKQSTANLWQKFASPLTTSVTVRHFLECYWYRVVLVVINKQLKKCSFSFLQDRVMLIQNSYSSFVSCHRGDAQVCPTSTAEEKWVFTLRETWSSRGAWRWLLCWCSHHTPFSVIRWSHRSRQKVSREFPILLSSDNSI